MENATKQELLPRIACVQLDHALPTVFDRVVFPRYGLPVIGTILSNAGYDVKVFEEHIAPIDMDWLLTADIVLFSTLTGAANRTYELSNYLRSKKPNIVTVIGGEHATNFIEESLDWVDFVVRGEGDDVIVQLIKAIEKGGPYEGISRVSYRRNGKGIHNEITSFPSELDTTYSFDIIHRYPKEGMLGMLLKHRKIKMITLQASRGCPFTCSFCVVHKLFGKNYQYRDADLIIREIKEKLEYGNDFLFVDNLFTGSSKKVNAILDKMIEEGFADVAEFSAFSRIDVADKPELLTKLKKAGFRTLILGIESLDNDTLDRVNKRQSMTKIENAVKTIHDHGLLISATYVVGNEEDGKDAIKSIIDFSIKNNLSQIILLSLWAYPGDEDTVLSPPRIIMKSFDYFGGNYVVHFPMRTKPSTLQIEMIKGMKRFWSLRRAITSLLRGDFRTALQIFFHYYSYQGIWREQKQYADYLKNIERGYYDDREVLDLNKIATRPLDPIVARASKVSGLTINTNLSSKVKIEHEVRGPDQMPLPATP